VTFIDESLRLIAPHFENGRCRFSVEIDGKRFDDLEIKTFGRIQMHNAALAIAACKKLEDIGLLRLDRDHVATALRNTALPARVEHFPAGSTRLSLPYPICLDSAHTPKSMTLLAESLGDLFPDRKPTLLVGLLKDKNLEACILPFRGRVAQILATDVRSPRALPAYELLCRIRAALPTTASAILPSIAADPSQLKEIDVAALVVAGSAYLADDLRRALA
jgi:dihydrofolate synthase/folylpolyglutamate synthase